MKRLIKKSEFFDSTQQQGAFGPKLIEFFKNPTDKEIQICKTGGDYKSIRGVILDDGTEYCWRGDILHTNVSSIINVDQFRFAIQPDGTWIFDTHNSYKLEEIYNLIVKYKEKLSKYGNLSGPIDIFFVKDSPSRCIALSGINEIEDLLDDMNITKELPIDEE